MTREYPKLVEGGFIRILNIDGERERFRRIYEQKLEDYINSLLTPNVYKIPKAYSESCLLLSGCLNRIVQVASFLTTRKNGSQIALTTPKYKSGSVYIDTETMEIEIVAQSEVADYNQFFPEMRVTLTHSDGILYELNIGLNDGYDAYPVQNEASEKEKKAIFHDLRKEDLQVYLVEPSEKRVLIFNKYYSRRQPIFVDPKFLIPTQ